MQLNRFINRALSSAVAFGMALSSAVSAATPDKTSDSAVVLLYHHVSASTPASTSVSPETFRTHMTYLAEHYTVMPLPDIIDALKNKQSLPANAIAVTFDDGYNDILDNGHPIMQNLGLPYTIFINPQEIGVQGSQLTWDEVKRMHQEGVDFANHTLDHLHMLDKKPDESQQQWLNRVWQNVEQAEAQITEHTGESLKYLAYPFGEYNEVLATQLKKHGYIGFGQHSGGIGVTSDFTALPRFPAAGNYANMQSLKTKIASLAMPVIDNSMKNPESNARTLDKPLSFTVTGDDVGINRMACYFQGDALPVSVKDMTVSYTVSNTLPIGRSRVNCTAPSRSQAGRYYWYSQPFFVARQDGTYPD